MRLSLTLQNIYPLDHMKLIQKVGTFTVPQESLAELNQSSTTDDFRFVGSGSDAGVGGLLEGALQIHCLVSHGEVDVKTT